MTIRRALLLSLWLAVPLQAHPGHGSDGGSHSLLHYLFESPHAWPWLSIACIACSLAILARRRRTRRMPR